MLVTKHQEVRLNWISENTLHRLIERGHPVSTLEPIFQYAINLIDQEENGKRITITTSKKLQHILFHQQFHSNNILCCAMWNSYKKTCNATNAAQNKSTRKPLYTELITSVMCIEQVKSTYYRMHNLQDILTSLRLHQVTRWEVSHTLASLKRTRHTFISLPFSASREFSLHSIKYMVSC